MEFEDMINFLSELSCSELFTNVKLRPFIEDPHGQKENAPIELEMLRKYKADMGRIGLTQKLLDVIETDYERYRTKVEKLEKALAE